VTGMRKLLATLLQRLGFPGFELLVRQVSTYPSDADIAPGEIVHVVDAGIEKWACLKCPGGCGAVIPLNLNPKRRPRWNIGMDLFRRPSVKPSVHQKNGCGCHFWITRGSVQWCKGGRPAVANERQ